MNRSELAALLAAQPPVQSTPSAVMFQDEMAKPIPSSPTSPRLEFQSRVRRLQQQSSPSQRGEHVRHRRHSELEHVSSLRVTSHQRSQSAQPASQETPDFWADEQKAWGQRSPKSPSSRQPSFEIRVGASLIDSQTPILSPPSSQTHPILQPSKQSRVRAPLRAFEPLHTITDVDERPRTSRGRSKVGLEEERLEDISAKGIEEGEENNDSPKPSLPSISTEQVGRASRFTEGSMNDRSCGTASSWYHDAFTDEIKPLPPTPAVKHVTFNCTTAAGLQDQPLIDLTATKKKERRGLRTSISNFNFQALSEKMKIFATANNDTAAEAAENDKGKMADTGVDVLKERKRKADEAYAAQFGFKKQKFSAAPSGPAPSPNVGRQPEYSHNENQNHRTLRGSRRFGAASSFTNPGLSKKKSRRELEQDNALLRARIALHGHYSPPSPPNPREQPARHNAANLSPKKNFPKRRGKQGEDVPPVPQLPSRGILKVLEEGKRNSRTPSGLVVNDRKEEGGEKVTNHHSSHIAQQHWEWPEDVF